MSGLLKNSRQLAAVISKRMSSSAVVDPNVKIGARQVVGFGFNGTANYVDRPDIPMPAVRWRPDTSDIKDLRFKEKGDWKSLTVAEKKALYRASFCQTIAEMNAPDGEWKSTLGLTLVTMSLAVWLYMFFRLFAYNPELPESFSEESQRAQLRRMIDLQMNPIEGLASQYPRPK